MSVIGEIKIGILPFKPAPKLKYGSDKAEPTKWVAWALTLPPSWSLRKKYNYTIYNFYNKNNL